jgi:hypothetical protein
MNTKDALVTLDAAPLVPRDPQNLLQLAITNKTSLDVVEQLMRLQKAYDEDQSIRSFNRAMSGFQGECPIIPKRKVVLGKGGGERYRFAPMDAIIKTVQPLMLKWGFSYHADVKPIEGDRLEVTLTVIHTDGYSRQSHFQVQIDREAYMNVPQQFASAQSFARRYAFCNAFGIMTGDEDNDNNTKGKDDGQGAMEQAKRELWELLKPVRGEKESWVQSIQWLVDECCLDPDAHWKELTVADVRAVLGKAKIKITAFRR